MPDLPSPPPQASTRSAAEILAQAACDLLGVDRPELARDLARQAAAESSDCLPAHTAAGAALDRLGAWHEALPHWRRAVALAPHGAQMQFNLALALLRLEDYREGLARYEARIDKPDWSCRATVPSRVAERRRLLRPGESVDGRRILVVTEQGLGDCILFARYLPLLARRGARITLVCNPPLRSLFERTEGVESVLSPPADQPLAKVNLSQLSFDAWVPLMSLAWHFGTTPESVPAGIPYLRPDPAQVAAWRDRYTGSGRPGVPKIGLVFQANPASGNAGERSMTVADLLPLLDAAGVDVVNLQHGPAGRALAASRPRVIDATAQEMPLDAFAAAVAATDLLVSVDTMAAHCAGAIGHPLWVAVPFSPHWYWRITGRGTPWYPQARLFRQEARGTWARTVHEIGADLARACRTRAP